MIFSYVIDHNGDPCEERNILKLGVQKCKPKIRKKASIGDWVIATLGKRFLNEEFDFSFIEKHKTNYQNYLVYAMRVTNKKNGILYSSNYVIFDTLIKIPKRFKRLIKQQQGHKKVDDDKIIELFEKWVTNTKSNKSSLLKKKRRC